MEVRSRSRSRAPPGGGGGGPGGRPGKRLIVACDGTWKNSDNGLINGTLSIPSNVTRISRAIKPVSQDGIPQIVYYHFGVGTQGGVVNRVVGGTTGEGLADAVKEGYSFLANNHAPGDEIFLIGFSRGAFTARSIAGLVAQVGLLTKQGLRSLPEVFRDVQHCKDPEYVPRYPNVPFPNKPSADNPRYDAELERRGLSRLNIPIKAIAVWDTVGSLGTPRVEWLTRLGLQDQESKEMSYHDTKLSRNIEHAFQALALDERRPSFAPAVWEKPEGNRTVLRQVWFPGVHSNVGGGYDDQQLSNITLAWMMAQLEPFLDMRDEIVLEEDRENEKYYRKMREDVRPWSFGEIYNSNAGLYSLGGGQDRTPGCYFAVDPRTGRATSRPLRQTNEYIHPSVRTRYRLNGPGVDDKGTYDPHALTDNYKLVVNYAHGPKAGNAPGTVNGNGPDEARPNEPDIYWKARSRDVEGLRILPEAPLWRLERELAMRDPRTYDYVKRPPVTGSSSSGGRRPPPADAIPPGRSRPRRERDTAELLAPPSSRRRNPSRGPRRSFVDGAAPPDMPPMAEMKRSRSRVRPRSVDGERESVIRGEMPHSRRKDRAWWEEEREREREREERRRDRDRDRGGDRGPRRSSMMI